MAEPDKAVRWIDSIRRNFIFSVVQSSIQEASAQSSGSVAGRGLPRERQPEEFAQEMVNEVTANSS
jgi:hypothetical protein